MQIAQLFPIGESGDHQEEKKSQITRLTKGIALINLNLGKNGQNELFVKIIKQNSRDVEHHYQSPSQVLHQKYVA